MSEKQTLVQRAQRALRGEEPWEPIMERITSFVRGDLDAEIAALTERLRIVEAERDEWKRKYETQCAGSMSAHERRIHLEADLSALREELERKDAALKEAHEYMQKADDDLTSVLESRSPYGEERRRYEMSRNGMDYFEMARDVLGAALRPKEPS